MDIFLNKNLIVGFLRHRKTTIKNQGMFLSRLGEMLANGFTLAEAIDFLGKINKKNHAVSQAMLLKLQDGIAIHEVLSEESFDKKACTQIFLAEKHGDLPTALEEAGNYLLKKDSEQKTLKKLLQYPLLLMVIISFIFMMMKNILLPQFTDLYNSMNYHPSRFNQFITHLMNHAPLYISILMGIFSILLFLILFFYSRKSPITRSEFIAKLPFIGIYIRMYNSQFLARECGFLLKSGFSINEVLECMASQSYRPLVRDVAVWIRADLTKGASFSLSLTQFSLYDPQLIQVIRHGEKNGRLDQELLYYSRYCLTQIEEKIQNLFAILQPIVFVIIGLLILAVYMSIMLPMFDMMDSI